MKDFKYVKSGMFLGGLLFGTAGIRILTSKDAKNLYTQCTAAVLRAKKCIMKTVSTVQENAEDIYEGAKQINEEREAAEEACTVEDASEEEKVSEEAVSETEKTEEA